MFDITEKHPDFIRMSDTWDLMRDAYEGEAAVKEKGERYLPKKSGIRAMPDLRKQRAAYNAYQHRAEFPEIVAPTVRGIAGLIHRQESVIELPTALEPLREKATLDGLTLDQVHRKITTELLLSGRFGLMPGVLEGEPYFALYKTEAVINWDSIDGDPILTVLDESGKVRDPLTNKWGKQEVYRELYVEEGRFGSRTWRKMGEKFVAEEDEDATIQGRERLGFIPFVFAGAQDLTPAPDQIPLQGLARLALRAYMLDADYVNTLHMTSEPTPWVTGVPKEDAPRSIGAATLWVLESPNAQAGMLEFSGPGVGAQREAIRETLERAVMFGANLFADNRRSAESGEALSLRFGQQTSQLKMVSAASAAALERALRNLAIWVGANPDEVMVQPNMEFLQKELSPQEIAALVQGWMEGAYSKMTLFTNLQRGGVIESDVEFEDEEGRISFEDLTSDDERDDALPQV